MTEKLQMFSLLSVLCLASVVTAHNWVNVRHTAWSQTREKKAKKSFFFSFSSFFFPPHQAPARTSLTGNVASTVFPVLAASRSEPHVVVTAGQRFPMEWVVGHNADSYVVLLKKSEAGRMNMHTTTNLEAFLKDAACPQTAPRGRDAIYHYKYNDPNTTFYSNPDQNGVRPAPIPNFYKRLVPATDANFIPRPKEFLKGVKGMPRIGGTVTAASRNAMVTQFEYQDADVATNRRCYPATPVARFPWIIGMHKGRHVRHQPSEPDVVLLQFPADTAPGDYIVHWIWRSYYDAVDVRVVAGTTPIANPFGGAPTTGGTPAVPQVKFTRVDRCRFPNATLAGTCVKMTAPANGRLPVPTACLDACKAMTPDKCNGVAVVPLANPASVARTFANLIQIPFTAGTCVRPTDASTHMCFPLVERPTTDVTNSILVIDDTEDPSFYATCFRRQDLVKRDGLPDPADLPYVSNSKPKWQAMNECISCAQVDLYDNEALTPVYEVADKCRNCDIN